MKKKKTLLRWINTRVVWDKNGNELVKEGYWYSGALALAHPNFTIDVDIYRWRDDDGTNETDATWLEIESTAHDFTVTGGDVESRLRVNISEVGGADDNNAAQYQLFYTINGGTFVLVTNATTGVQYFDSTKLTNDNNTTNQLTGGGTFNGTTGVCEDGVAAAYLILANNDHEIEYTVKFIAADLSNNDTVTFQIVSDTDGLVVETVTPTATITKAGDTTAPVLSSPTGTKTGSTTADGTVVTDEGNGILYYRATTNSSETAATIKAGSSQSVTATGSQAVSFTGLTAATTYYAHYVHDDAIPNESNVVSSTSFTTDAAASGALIGSLAGDGGLAGNSGGLAG